MIYKVGEYKDRDTYLRHCLRTVGDMEHIVKEILSAARMGGSDFQLVRSDLNISQILQKVCRKNSGRMEDKEMDLNMEIQPDFHYEGDGRLIEKVFSNVISNAAAYSPVGAVITVSLQNGVFSVENSGVHIAEEDLKQIFTPFYRVDKSRNRNSGGSGLGLYITKRYSTITVSLTKWRIQKTACGLLLSSRKQQCRIRLLFVRHLAVRKS